MTGKARTAAALVFTAVAYLMGARLSNHLSIPPGYATVVWPSAGVALAAVLLWGRAMAVGVGVGSVLANIWIGVESRGTPDLVGVAVMAALIAVGAALQALAARWLLSRAHNPGSILERNHELRRFVVLGVLVPCVVSASVGVTTLLVAGAIPWGNFVFTWLAWWGGDAIGALTFAPLMLVAFVDDPYRGRRVRTVAVPTVVVFSLVTGVFVFARGWETEDALQRQKARGQSVERAIEASIFRYLEVLASLDRFLASGAPIQRVDFERFAGGVLDEHPGIHALSWNPIVVREKRASFEEAMHDRERGAFQITERDADRKLRAAGDRGVYVPVAWIVPWSGNETAWGFDVASSDVRRRALDVAAQTGKAVATEPIELVQTPGQRDGILVFRPVIGPESEGVTGYAVGVFRISRVVGSAISDVANSRVMVRLELGAGGAGWEAVWTNEPALDGELPLSRVPMWETSISFTDAVQWRLQVLDLEVARERPWHAWFVLASGVLFCGILQIVLLGMSGSLSQAERMSIRQLMAVNSELKQKQAVLRQQSLALEQANAALTRFTYAASHDLQEPIRTMRSYLEIIDDEHGNELSEDGRTCLDFARSGADTLASRVTALLRYARIGESAVSRKSMNADRLVDIAVMNLRTAIGESGAEICREQPLPEVYADADLLGEVFENVISNAIKFRSTDPPRLEVAGKEELGGTTLVFADNGIGIADEDHERAFMLFSRLNHHDGPAGTGLGLALCKQIIEAHGGRIWLERNKPRGTRVCMWLPGCPQPIAAPV